MKKCDQEKCAFNNPLFAHMCPVCSDCKAEPHEINEDCVNCWNCLKDQDFIRSGEPRRHDTEKESESEGEITIEVIQCKLKDH